MRWVPRLDGLLWGLCMAAAVAGCTGTETGNPHDDAPLLRLALRGFSANPQRADFAGEATGEALRIQHAWVSIEQIGFVGGQGCTAPFAGASLVAAGPGVVDLAAGPLRLPDIALPQGEYCSLELTLGAVPDAASPLPAELQQSAAVLLGSSADGQAQSYRSGARETVGLPFDGGALVPEGAAQSLLLTFDLAAWVSDSGRFAVAPSTALYADASGEGDFNPAEPPPLLAVGQPVSPAPVETPVAAVPSPLSVQQIFAGGAQTCALLSDGGFRCWGRNDYGQLGYGHVRDVGDDELPSAAPVLRFAEAVQSLALGWRHTCALLAGGGVRCWGGGYRGQLGNASTASLGDDEPISQASRVSLGAPAIELSAGAVHTCALLSTGALRCWGSSGIGQLGNGNLVHIGDNELPTAVGVLPLGALAEGIAAGSNHNCALLAGGSVRCWGRGVEGQLGYANADSIGDDEFPSAVGLVATGGAVQSLALGHRHTCAVIAGSAVRCWGEAADGKLGYGNPSNIGDTNTPASAGDVPVGGRVRQVVVGDSHSCALFAGGGVRCWGGGSRGRLGNASVANIGDDEPAANGMLVSLGAPALQLAAGDAHTCALLDGGSVRCWGLNDYGQLGLGNIAALGDDEQVSSVNPVRVLP